MSHASCFTYPRLQPHQRWGQLHGSALPLMISEFVQSVEPMCLVMAPNSLAASRIHQALGVFLEASADIELLFFPDWETLPYDRFSPYQDLVSQRLLTLNRMTQAKRLVIVSSISTLMQRVPPAAFLLERVWLLKVGQHMHLHRLRESLESVGYRSTTQVLEHGEYSIRGSLIDVFPMGNALPFRIELFDDEVESLRTFDPETQRTIEKMPSLHFFPAREFPTDEAAIALFRKKYREVFPGNASQSLIYEAVTAGQFPSGIEYYLPLFYEKTATLLDYLPASAPVFFIEDVRAEADKFWKEVQSRYEEYRHDVSRPILSPEMLFIDPLSFFKQTRDFSTIQVSIEEDKKGYCFQAQPAPSLPVQRKSAAPLETLLAYLEEKSTLTSSRAQRGISPSEASSEFKEIPRCARDDVPRGRVGDEKPWRILFITEGAGRREIVLDLLTRAGVFPVVQTSWGDFLKDSAPISMLVAPLEQGLELTEAKISVIVESQLFGELGRVAQRAKQAKSIDPDVMIRDLIELQVGAPVVHLEHGVGRYLGLKTIEIQAVQQDFMELLYADGDKIFVPVTALHQVTRYTGVQADHAPLNRLGSGTWQREKKKATEVIHDLAVELLEIYAKRQIKTGTAFHLDASEYERFVSDFAFIETADQDRAIQDILKDLQKETAMERLICGDVGFGKTEVAMRAAFLAVQNDKQVCVLVPTTLLASQHYETFCERFASFPIQVRILSRFQQAKECTATIEALKKGTVDIVIGTHKLLNQSLVFKDLGLLIIDEEHRFGVKQKEKIKAIKNDVHCLTMTATPIPRTLNMAMSGLRDISLIATPPAKRLAIKTFWREKNPALVREAVLREIFRGGQVFYVHNEVDSIQRVAEELQTLLPEALVRFAHGQMSERLLERIMSDFYHQRFNVLVCTTIIETGIDIPTANTLMIDRADKFGLAQLHQLRGRVGRSHHQAYAYLFTPAEKTMTSDAVKRLEAIVSLEDLGAGFILATQDLEIRGAGELLGDEQSGNMHAIGFTLYMELLDRAVTALREGKEPALLEPMLQGPEIDVYFSALLPEDYVGDIHTRLILYKRISNAVSEEDLERIQVELIDRFGLLPIVVKHLFQVTQLKLKAKPLGIHKIQLAKGEGKIGFAEQPNIRPEVLIELIQKEPTRYRLQGPKSLRFQLSTESVDIALRETAGLFERLTR